MHADLESCLHDAVPVPERQPGFLVNDLIFVAGSSAMARVRRMRLRHLSCQDKAGQLRRRHKASCSRGTTRAAKRNAAERARKGRLKGAFSSRFVRGSLCQIRAGRGLALRRCPPSLCVLCFHRDGGCGDLSIGGGR